MSIQIGVHNSILETPRSRIFNNERIKLLSDVQSNLIEIVSGCNSTSITMDHMHIISSNSSSNLLVSSFSYDVENPYILLSLNSLDSKINSKSTFITGDVVAKNINIEKNVDINDDLKINKLITSNLAIYTDNSFSRPFVISSNGSDILALDTANNLFITQTNIGIGTTNSQYSLYVAGNMYSTESLYTSIITSNIPSGIWVNGNLYVNGTINSATNINVSNVNLGFSGITLENSLYTTKPAIQLEQFSGYEPLTVIKIVNQDDTKTIIQGISSSGRTYIGTDITDSARMDLLEIESQSNTPSMFTVSLPYTFSNDHLLKGISYNTSNTFIISKDAYMGIGSNCVTHPLHLYINGNTNMRDNPLSNMSTLGIYHDYMSEKPFLVANSNEIRVFGIYADGSLGIGSNQKILLSSDGSIISQGDIHITGNIGVGKQIITSNLLIYNSLDTITPLSGLIVKDLSIIDPLSVISDTIGNSNLITSTINNYNRIDVSANIFTCNLAVASNASFNNMYISGYLTGINIDSFGGISTGTEFIPSAKGVNSVNHYKTSNILISVNPNYSSQLVGAINGNSNGVLQIQTYPMNANISRGISVYGNDRSGLIVTSDKPYYQLCRGGNNGLTYNLGINGNNNLVIGLSNNNNLIDYTESMITITSNITNGYFTTIGNKKTRMYVSDDGPLFISTENSFNPVLSQITGGFEVHGISYFRSSSGNPIMYMDPTTTNGCIGIGTTTPNKTLDISGDMIVSQSIGIGTTIPRRALDVIGTMFVSSNIGIGTTIPRKSLDIIGNMLVSSNIGIGTTNPYSSLHVEGNSIFMNGNIGIGTTQPVSFVHINYNNLMIDVLRIDDNIASDNTPFIVHNNGNIGIGTYISRQQVDVLGSVIISSNLGIGTTISLSTLHVEGTTIFRNANIGIGTTTPLAVMHIQYDGTSVDLLRIDQGAIPGTAPFIIKTDGNIGIGTTIPRKSLDIIGNMLVSSNIGIGTTNPYSSLHVEGNSIFMNGNIGIGTTQPVSFVHINYNNLMIDVLRIDDSIASDNTPFIIHNNGNIGIGTYISRQQVDVLGSVIISSNLGIGTTISLSTLHVEGTTIFINANIGIGTTTPLAVMHIQYDGTSVDLLRIDQGAIPGTAPFIIKKDGNIGIGTDNPQQKLDIQNNMIVSSNIGIGTTVPMRKLHVEGTLINMNGNIGIGTIIPNARMHIAGIGSSSITLSTTTNLGATLAIMDEQSTIGNGGMLMFGASNGHFAAIKGAMQSTTDNSIGNIIFTTRNSNIDSNLTTRMYIQNNGNIGIGTTIPIEKVHIGNYGNCYIEGESSARNFQPGYIGSWLPKMFSMPDGSTSYVNVSVGNTNAKGFAGGFTDGQYTYLVPYQNGSSSYHGIFTRVDTSNYTTSGVSYVNVSLGNTDAKGFYGGFTDGSNAYLVPNQNSSTSYHGILTRVNLQNYTTTGVTYVDVSLGNTNAKGFRGGFTDGRYTYLIPFKNNNTATSNHGIFTRVDNENYSTSGVSYVDVSLGNTNAKGFIGGFTDGLYAYLVPETNCLLTRVNLDNLSVTYVDVSLGNTNANMFAGGFTDGRYAYLIPYKNNSILTRVDMQNYSITGVSYLDVSIATGNTNAKGFVGGFTDGRYTYLVPNQNTSYHSIFSRVDMQNYTTTGGSYLDVSLAGNTNAKGFAGGFTDGLYSYLVPNQNGSTSYHDILTRVMIGDIYQSGY